MKKGLIVGIVVVVIIVSAVFFLFDYMHKEAIDSTELEENDCENYNTFEECSSYLECGWILNESKCVLINTSINTTDDKESDQEIEEIDINNLSNSICNKIPVSSEMGSEDKYYCLAVVNHNATFCEKMFDDTEEIGTLEESENLEDNDTTPYDVCLAISTENSFYCKKITRQDAKKTCYNNLAQISGDINICNEIDYSQDEKQQCYFNFVNALYWENKSEEITTEDCAKIEDSMDKKTCLAFKNRDVSLCESNKNCLTFFPQEMSFCNGATFKDEDECIRDRALVNKDVSICGTLSEQTSRDDCYMDFSGHIQPSIAICDKIIGGQRRQGCYINAAINLAK